MARPQKIGIDYFAFDTDFANHPVIKMVIAEFQAKGYIITIELLCYIFSQEGYYMYWDEKTKLLFSNSVAWCGATANLCEQVVVFLVKWGYFDKNLFNTDKVLTNERCQKNFLEASRKRKNTRLDSRYDIISENGLNKHDFPAEETTKKAEESTQSKVKETKENVLTQKEFPAEETLGIAHWKIVGTHSYSETNEEFRKRYTEQTFVAYQKFNKWLDDEYSFIRERTKQQITIYDFQRLQKKFTTEQIMSGIAKVASSSLNDDHNLYARLTHFIDKPYAGAAGSLPQKTIQTTAVNSDDLSKKDIYANG